jgi:ketosteroid isomerase-like protein
VASQTEQQQHNRELAQRLLAVFDPEQADAVLAVADPEIEVFASRDLANSGTFHGHDGFLTWITQWLDAWENYKLDLLGIEPVGERHVIAWARQTATGKGSGVPVDMEVTFMVELRDEKIAALHLYPAAEEAREVAQRRESGAD